jgi:hypothetical protein
LYNNGISQVGAMQLVGCLGPNRSRVLTLSVLGDNAFGEQGERALQAASPPECTLMF